MSMMMSNPSGQSSSNHSSDWQSYESSVTGQLVRDEAGKRPCWTSRQAGNSAQQCSVSASNKDAEAPKPPRASEAPEASEAPKAPSDCPTRRTLSRSAKISTSPHFLRLPSQVHQYASQKRTNNASGGTRSSTSVCLSTATVGCDESLHTAPPSLLNRSLYADHVCENDTRRQHSSRLCIYLHPPPTTTATAHPATSALFLLYRRGHAQRADARMNSNAAPSPTVSVSDLLSSLTASDLAAAKMAAFKLQSLTTDPAFAEHFVAAGGLPRLRDLILIATGNTLAYALASFARLLEVDQGWEGVDGKVVQKAVELVVCEPLVNILRGALGVLVAIVGRSQQSQSESHSADRVVATSKRGYIGGFKALKPAIGLYPQFLEMLVSRLSSADHSLCANALQLINSLMRDAITNDDEQEWPKFIKRIQDLGVIKAVYILMQSSALQDLAVPLLDFQALTKILLRRWREVAVDLNKPEHRRTIKALHLSSNPEKSHDFGRGMEHQPKHNPYKWRRLGFTSESPEPEFEEMGFLGMMDLSDYVRKHQDEFQHILLEQATVEEGEKRCPIARASLVVTAILFEHYEVDKTELEDTKNYLALESRTNFEMVFKPLLLHWSRLHVAGLHAFLRLWKATGAELEDFFKIVELIRILIESVVGGAERTKGIEQVEQELASYDCSKLRELQMELLELTYEDIWGQHLRGVREELRAESLQFVKEQRIRCLLSGAWFLEEENTSGRGSGVGATESARSNYRFIKLSPDRKYLHFGIFEETYVQPPSIGMLHDRIDLSIVSSVVSNITASDEPAESLTGKGGVQQERYTTTKISIHGYAPEPRSKSSASRSGHRSTQSRSSHRPGQKEVVLLTFQPSDHKVASEWLDGLLMLLEQQPITTETNKLISMISEYGLKVRLLNVRFNDEEGLIEGMDAPPIPTRDGLDEDYYYEI